MEKQEAAQVWVRTSLHTGATTYFHQSPLEECAMSGKWLDARKQTFRSAPLASQQAKSQRRWKRTLLPPSCWLHVTAIGILTSFCMSRRASDDLREAIQNRI